MQPNNQQQQMQQPQGGPGMPYQQQPQAMPSQGTPQPPQPAANTAEATTPPPPNNPNTTQNTLLFSEIRDNMVVMNDGSFRAVVACKSINFDLMSSKEREGIEYSYQNFLNSLYFPVQMDEKSAGSVV